MPASGDRTNGYVSKCHANVACANPRFGAISEYNSIRITESPEPCDRRQSSFPSDDKLNSRLATTTTIGPMRFQTMGTERVGHRQASAEVVRVGKDRGKLGNSVVEGRNGFEDGEEVSAVAAAAE
jgi:hypothetical protein